VIHHLKLVLAVESLSSTLITLGALLLDITLELPLCVVSVGKLVLPFFVIVSRSRVSW
jgi:hypothetical protein